MPIRTTWWQWLIENIIHTWVMGFKIFGFHEINKASRTSPILWSERSSVHKISLSLWHPHWAIETVLLIWWSNNPFQFEYIYLEFNRNACTGFGVWRPNSCGVPWTLLTPVGVTLAVPIWHWFNEYLRAIYGLLWHLKFTWTVIKRANDCMIATENYRKSCFRWKCY